MEASVYREMADRTARGFNLRCIDGALRGRSKCVGFCACEQHPGFLTARQEREHRCREKGCFYHYAKPAVQRNRRDENRVKQAEIMAAAQAATAQMEGLRALRAAQEPGGGWTVWYAAIAGYDLSQAQAQLCKETQCRVSMKPLRCDFDTAAALVTGSKPDEKTERTGDHGTL